MPKDKRSFFERITGSISVAHDRPEPDHEPAISEPETEEEIWEEENEDGELAVDVYQTPTDIVIQTMIAGVRPNDIDITITREMATIRGHRDRGNTTTSKDYFHQELYWGSFARTIMLPAEVESEEAEATEKHGLLTIRLPKIDKDKVHQVKVKTTD